MSNDDPLFNYVQTVLEDQQTPSTERVATVMESIEGWVRAEHGMAPDDSFGDVPQEWAHKVPKPLGEPGILLIPVDADVPKDASAITPIITYGPTRLERWRDWWMGPR